MDQRLNAIKGVSIFLVICIHMIYYFFPANNRPGLFNYYNLITSIAVPNFMIIGGYLFAKKYNNERLIWRQYSVKLLIRIVLPYYSVVILLSLYNFSIRNRVFWNSFLFIDANEHGLYFLISYTYASLFCAIIYSLFYNLSSLKLSILVTLLGAPLIFFEGSGNVFSQLHLISLFCFGTILYYLDIFLTKKNNVIRMIVMIAPLLVTIVTILISGKYYKYIPVTSVVVFVFAINLLRHNSLFKFTKQIKLIEFGIGSMSIYLIHPFLLKIVNPIVKKFLDYFEMSYFNNTFILPICLISFMIAILSNYLANAVKQFKKGLVANLLHRKPVC